MTISRATTPLSRIRRGSQPSNGNSSTFFPNLIPTRPSGTSSSASLYDLFAGKPETKPDMAQQSLDTQQRILDVKGSQQTPGMNEALELLPSWAGTSIDPSYIDYMGEGPRGNLQTHRYNEIWDVLTNRAGVDSNLRNIMPSWDAAKWLRDKYMASNKYWTDQGVLPYNDFSNQGIPYQANRSTMRTVTPTDYERIYGKLPVGGLARLHGANAPAGYRVPDADYMNMIIQESMNQGAAQAAAQTGTAQAIPMRLSDLPDMYGLSGGSSTGRRVAGAMPK